MLNKLYSGFLLAVIFCVTVHVLVSNLRLTPLVWVGLGILSIVLGRFLKHLAISLGLMVGGSLIILDCVPFWGIYGNGMPMIIVLTILGFGGIFISISFIHILPEVSRDFFEKWSEKLYNFPLPFFTMFWGYAFILIVDKLIFTSHDHHGHSHT